MDSEYLTPEETAILLKISKYTVYEMVKRGQLPAKRLGRKILIHRNELDLYLKTTNSKVQPSSALMPQPTTESEVAPHANTIYFTGSHDLSIDILVEHLSKYGVSFFPVFAGSLEGLMELFKGRTDMAGCHLFDPQSESYNFPFISRLLPQEDITVVHFVERWQGLMLPPGNPKKITSWKDFFSNSIRIVNRQKGSGTRVLLDYHLQKHGIPASQLSGYSHEERNHYATASAVLRGVADAALGIESAARSLGLDFIPLEKESYDFVIPTAKIKTGPFQTLLQVLQNKEFKQAVNSLSGYDTTRTGDTVVLT